MTKIIRLDDTSDHGGYMSTASGHFKVDGKEVCVNGDEHTCPIPGHGTTQVTSTSTLKSSGKSVIHVGDKAGCGATLNSGSPDTGSN